jgi:serine/threonine protein kinase
MSSDSISLDDNSTTSRADAAIAEFLEGVERGAPPNLDEFLALYQDVETELREFLEDYKALEKMSPRVSVDCAGARWSGGTTPPGLEMPLTLPRVFGNFELLNEIARGGMGIVYKAHQTKPSRVVALKMILTGRLASKKDRERFYAEAEAAAALDHPNIVPIFETGECEGQHYFTMGFVEGESLADRLARGPLLPREAAAIVRDVALAAHYAHERGIIHRDLKPANILIDQQGRVRVTDFGLARQQTDATHLTCTGQLLGTPSFMPPEQIAGQRQDIGPSADIYALGATLYTLVCGRPPFQAGSIADTLRQVAEQEPLALRQFDRAIPRDLETIALNCLQKLPARRYQTAQDLADDLQRFLSDLPIVARRTSHAERVVRWCRRNPLVAALSGAAAATLIGALIMLILSNWRIRSESAALAEALDQKDAALSTAHEAVNQMLTEVADKKFSDIPLGHPLRVSLLKDALKFYEGLAQLDEKRTALGPEMATVLHEMAGLQRELGQNEEAQRSLKQGLALLSENQIDSLATEELRANMELDLAYTMEAAQSNRVKAAAVEAQYQRALGYFHDLEKRSPNQSYPYAIALRYLAERAFKRGELPEAERLWRESIANGEACLTQRPDDLDTRISVCWTCTQFFEEDLSNSPKGRDEGEEILEKGLTHVGIALNQKPHSIQARHVCASLNFCLALSNCHAGQVDEAIALFKKSAETMETLCAEFPWTEDYWNTLQWFISGTAKSLKEQDRLDAAQDALRGVAAWIKQQHSADPKAEGFVRQTQSRLVTELRGADLDEEADGVIAAGNRKT